MKIAPAQYRGFCQTVPEKIRSVLFYGDSEADITPKLIKFVQQGMGHKISDFQFIDSTSLIKKEIFLADLTTSQSLFGPPEPIIIQKATDKLAPAIEDYLENNTQSGIVIVISDSYLKPSSKLRQMYEKEDTLAVVACYARTVPEVSQNIMEITSSLDKTIERAAAQTLAGKIIQGTVTVENEINKIINYIGPDQKNITLRDVQDCSVANTETTEKQIYDAFLLKKWQDMPFLFLEASCQDINEIGLLRGLNTKLLQILAIKTLLDEGKSLDQASRIVSPPIFFQEKEIINFAVRNWEVEEIKYTLNKLLEIEETVKYASGSLGSLFSMTIFSDFLKKKWKKG